MPRKSPLSETDSQIGRRLVLARSGRHLSRSTFAQIAGVDSAQISRYEHLRAPLKCGDALKICGAHCIGLLWIATGKGPMDRPPFGLAPHEAISEWESRRPLSKVWEEYLAAKLDRWVKPSAAKVEDVKERLIRLADLSEMGLVEDGIILAAAAKLERLLVEIERDVARGIALALESAKKKKGPEGA